MAGHTIALYLLEQGHEVITYSRSPFPYGHNVNGELTDDAFLQSLLLDLDYDIVINCIGVLNDACDEAPANAVFFNSYLPHKIVQLLENEGLGFDEIIRKLNLDPAKIGTLLSMMEIKGIIKLQKGGIYIIGT